MSQTRFEAIIFDHDGTLIDTETADFIACQTLCDELGLTLPQTYWADKVVGRINGYDDMFDELIQGRHNGFTKEQMWQRLRELWPAALENASVMPGVTSLLPQLQAAGYPLGVATASDRAWANRWLTRFDLLPYFQVIATSDDIRHNKPAPDVYLFAAAQLGVPPERCLVFEDSLTGSLSAKAAGMTVVAVPNHMTRLSDFSHAHHTITGLDEIDVAWIETLARRLQSNNHA